MQKRLSDKTKTFMTVELSIKKAITGQRIGVQV